MVSRLGDQTLPLIDAGRPLLIVDVDEVLMEFVRPLEQFLGRRGITVNWDSYALLGNIREASTGRALEREELLAHVDAFFAEDLETQEPVPHAADALADLTQDGWQVIVLTNVPRAQKDRRIAHLKRHGMDYPLLANEGGKGPAVRAITQGHARFSAFIDDAAPNHLSVAKHAPHVHRIHTIADPRLARVAVTPDGIDHREDHWPSLLSYLKARV